MFLVPPFPQLPLHYLSGARKWPLWASRQNPQDTFVGAGSSGVERFLPPLCLTWAKGPIVESWGAGPDTGAPRQCSQITLGGQCGPCSLMHSPGSIRFPCQQQVTCRGTALWAWWTLVGRLTEGSACPGVPGEPESEAASSSSQQGTKSLLVCGLWATSIEMVSLPSTAA